MNNPFEIINARLSKIEDLLFDLKQHNEKKELPEAHSAQFISRKKAASILGISLGSLNDYCKRGIIPSFRIRGRVLLKEESVLGSVSLVKSVKHKKGLID